MHNPTDQSRIIVKELYSCGVTQERIAQRLGITDKTLRNHYREELDDNLENMISALTKNLYQDAINGDAQAREFWLKTRGRFHYYKPPEEEKKSNMETLLEKLVDKL